MGYASTDGKLVGQFDDNALAVLSSEQVDGSERHIGGEDWRKHARLFQPVSLWKRAKP